MNTITKGKQKNKFIPISIRVPIILNDIKG